MYVWLVKPDEVSDDVPVACVRRTLHTRAFRLALFFVLFFARAATLVGYQGGGGETTHQTPADPPH